MESTRRPARKLEDILASLDTDPGFSELSPAERLMRRVSAELAIYEREAVRKDRSERIKAGIRAAKARADGLDQQA